MGGGDTDSSDMEEDRGSNSGGESSQDEMSQSIEERETGSEEFTEEDSKDNAT